MTGQDYIGWWTIDVPISQEQSEQDRPFLEAITAAIPGVVTVLDLRVAINGRIYEWQKEGLR